MSAPDFPADTDLLIVMLGTNDLLQGRSPEQAAARLERFLSGISLDRSKILVIAPPPVKRGAWVPDQQLIDDSRTFARLCPGPGETNGSPLCRRREVGHPPGLRWRPLHGAGPQGLCRRTIGGTQMKRIFTSAALAPAAHQLRRTQTRRCLPADHPGGSQRDDRLPGGHRPGCP